MLARMLRTLHTTPLRSYLDGLPRGEAAKLATRLGISSIYLLQLAARQKQAVTRVAREPSPELCVRIEEETGGAVTRQDMRPADWHRIWPELRATPAAPESATAAA